MAKMIKKSVSGGGAVSVSGVLADPSRVANAVAAKLAPFVANEARAILARARAQWPVYSGKSKAGLDLQQRAVVGTRVEYLLGTSEAYAVYIRSTKVGKEKDATRMRSVFQDLIRKPALAVQRRIADEAIRLAAEEIGNV